MTYRLSIACRLLAAAAWICTLAWFAFATLAAWGFTPGSLLLWSLPAVLLMRLTLRWWAEVGSPIAPETRAWLMRIWRNLAIAAGAYYVLILLTGWALGDLGWYEAAIGISWLVFGTVCAVFPVAVSGWAIARSLRLRASGTAHPEAAV